MHSVILTVGSESLPFPHPPLTGAPPTLGGQDFGINADLVMSINDQSPVLITPSFNLVVAIYGVPTTWKVL